MPITFHTKSYADLTFLSDVGKELITLMGHTPNVPGAIVADDLADALARLRAGLGDTSAESQPKEDARNDDAERPVGLSQRALPLIQLLEAAHADNENVMWD